MLGNGDRRKVLAILIAVTGIVLLMVSFVLPWYGTHTEVRQEHQIGATIIYYEFGGGTSISSGVSYSGGATSMYYGDFSTPIIFGVTLLLLILALIFILLMVVILIINLTGKNINSRLPMILGIFALIFCLLAPLVFMVALPGAMKADAEKRAEKRGDDYIEPDHDDPTKSFFGNYEEEDGDLSVTKSYWGGDIGWVLSFVSFVFLFISYYMIRPRKTVPPSSQYTPEMPYKPEPQPPHLVRHELPPPPPPR